MSMKDHMENPPNKNIVILSSRKPINYFLINELLADFSVALVIFEKQTLKKKFLLLLKRIKRLGLLKVFGQVLFIIFDMWYLKGFSESRVREILGKKYDALPSVFSLDVEDINSKEAQKVLLEAHPSVVVVSGTRILSPLVLSLAPHFLNIHTGITPLYRGVHGGFWALYDKDFENVGVTVHLIDKGVDTGKIVYQASIEVDSSDTPETISAKQYRTGVGLMKKALNEALAGNIRSFSRTDLKSKQWYHPTIFEYFQWRDMMKKL